MKNDQENCTCLEVFGEDPTCPLHGGPLRLAVYETFGGRCEVFDPECETCQAWAEIDRIEALSSPAPEAAPSEPARKFELGARVTKLKGSSWTGSIVGFYSTSLTPIGYAVESENEPGSVQIYPEAALVGCTSKMAMDWTKAMTRERQAGFAEGMERAAKIAETGYWSSALGDHVPNAIAAAIRSAVKEIES